MKCISTGNIFVIERVYKCGYTKIQHKVLKSRTLEMSLIVTRNEIKCGTFIDLKHI